MHLSLKIVTLSLCFVLLGADCSDDLFKAPNIYEGCCGTEPLRIDTLHTKIFVPNAISPNSDELNDAFAIYTNRPITIHKLKVLEQNEILGINRSRIKVFGETDVWVPINATGLPVHGLFNYEFEFVARTGDTLLCKGQFCSINCEEDETESIEFVDCIFQSVASIQGEVDTSALIRANNCDF